MTLSAPEFPLSLDMALQTLRDALGDNYGAATDTDTLIRALGEDAVSAPTGPQEAEQAHARPWATAARLIRWNTEYEVTKGLSARVDRKLQQLDAYQARMDAAAGIAGFIPVSEGSVGPGVARSGSVRTEGVW